VRAEGGAKNVQSEKRQPLLCLTLAGLLLGSGCGNTLQVEHGVRFSDNREVLVATALKPTCECTTLRNKSGTPIQILARRANIQTGMMPLVLGAGQAVPIAFDWAGDREPDYYAIFAYAADKPITGPWLKGQDVLEYDPSFQISCEAPPPRSGCRLDGPLRMNEAFGRGSQSIVEATVGTTAEIAHQTSGVNFEPDGELRLSSSIPDPETKKLSCGCAVLHSAEKIYLTATLHGARVGEEMTLEKDQDVPVAFDWAGEKATDYYVVKALPVKGVNYSEKTSSNISQTTEAPGAIAGKENTQTSLKIEDWVTVIGQVDKMECTADGSFLQTAGGREGITTADTDPPKTRRNRAARAGSASRGTAIECPFGPLGMNRTSKHATSIGGEK
jgi:hypothetical protein